MNANTYMQALLWCCASCGFTFAGNQPHMECPICEAYKTSFIDIPQHIEEQVRGDHKDMINTDAARKQRLELLRAGGFTKRFRVKGRVTESVHASADSRDYLSGIDTYRSRR